MAVDIYHVSLVLVLLERRKLVPIIDLDPIQHDHKYKTVAGVQCCTLNFTSTYLWAVEAQFRWDMWAPGALILGVRLRCGLGVCVRPAAVAVGPRGKSGTSDLVQLLRSNLLHPAGIVRRGLNRTH